MKTKRIYDEMYRSNLLYFTDCSCVQFIEKLSKQFDNNTKEVLGNLDEIKPAGFHVTFNSNVGKIYVIWVEDSKDIKTLSHEIVHLIYSIFQDKGVPTIFENQECFAYYMSFWLSKLV